VEAREALLLPAVRAVPVAPELLPKPLEPAPSLVHRGGLVRHELSARQAPESVR
jgi:hypothetical protein